MTEIEFHTNVDDKLPYACRLLRKAWRSGAKSVVTGEPALLAELDQMLWRFSDTEFIPHCMDGAGEQVRLFTPVQLTSNPENCEPDSVLVNLGQHAPAAFEQFDRFIEVVSVEQQDKLQGRARWKMYRDAGFALKPLDISAAAQDVG